MFGGSNKIIGTSNEVVAFDIVTFDVVGTGTMKVSERFEWHFGASWLSKSIRVLPDSFALQRGHFMIMLLVEDVPLTEYLPTCLLYTSPSPRDQRGSRMPSSA